MKFIDDSASFLLEKLKNHVILPKNLNIEPKIPKENGKLIKIKVFPLVCSKYLSSWTGLGRSGHVQITTFGSISHVSGPEIVF